jgi:16S rRNA (uracil1498-N3)-methyltransferase
MRKIRVFIDSPLTPGQGAPLSNWASDHLLRVLRLADGALVTGFNGDGHDYSCTLMRSGKTAYLRVDEQLQVNSESPLKITLAQAVARGEKMDWILQKATELGVHRIMPIITERTEVRFNEERTNRRIAHWTGVLRSACEQSGRAQVPEISEPIDLAFWLSSLTHETSLKIALHPEAGEGIRELTAPLQTSEITIAIGPEGGFSSRDLSLLKLAQFKLLRFGPRVLRTETAGVALLAAVQAMHGDLN